MNYAITLVPLSNSAKYSVLEKDWSEAGVEP